MPTVEIDREIFHQMMRTLAGGMFGPDSMVAADRAKMKLMAEQLAHATADRRDGSVVTVQLP